jgi:YVTN family beta-propeller protein
MRRRTSLLIAICAVFALRASAPDEMRARSAAIAVTPDGARVIVANQESSSVTIVDATTRTKIEEIGIACTPQTLTLAGERILVACRDGRVAVVGGLRKKAGVELFGIVFDGSRLFVSDYGASAVRVLDADTLEPITSIATEAYPRGLALEGKTLFVTHFRSGRISAIDTDTLTVTRVIATEADANLTQALAIRDGRAYVPQTRSNVSNPAILFDDTVFPVVSVVDLESGANLPTDRFSIDVIDEPVNMPIDAVATTSGKLYVVHAGSDDVTVIDLASRMSLAHIEVGTNPRSIALSPDERTVWVSNALAGTLSAIDTATDAVTDTIAVTTIPLPPNLLNGKILFNSTARTTLAKDQWISCATCHFEGGTDGRTWFFRDGPRNTPPLFGVRATLPMHWSGDLDELQDVEQTIRVVQAGTGLVHGDDVCRPSCDKAPPASGRSQDLDDLAAFMIHVQAPHRQPQTSDAIRRGEALFATAGCVSCHPAPLYTDRKKHDVGTGTELERKGNSFDTPSLRGLFDTAPYFHDGSAATLNDVLTRHGDASTLSAQEREDLVAFLNAIPFPQPKRRSAR